MRGALKKGELKGELEEIFIVIINQYKYIEKKRN